MKNELNFPVKRPQIVYDPITAAIASVLGVASGTVAYAVIGIAVNFGVSAIASFAMNAFAKKPPAPEFGGFLINETNPVAPAEYVYGEVRKGGVRTYEESTDGTNLLHRIIVLGAGQYEVGDIYLNDEIVTLSDDDFDLTDPSSGGSRSWTGAGWVTTGKWMDEGAVLEPRIRILIHDGSQTAATDTFANSDTATLANTLIAASESGLDANFVGKGLTYLYIQMRIDDEIYAGGIPRFTANVKGKKVADPRSDTTVYSSNWALCVADYLQASEGLGDIGSVDDTALSVEANVCDETIALEAGGTQKRYELNGIFRADEQPGEILARMMPSGSGNLFWGQGAWNIRAGDYAGSVASFGLDDLRSEIQLQTRTPRSQNYNAIRGVFTDKSQRYIEGEYPRLSSSTFIAEDGGFENVLDYNLPFETDGIRAQRLAKLALFRQREQMRFEADFSMRGAAVQPGDVIDLTVDRYGWNQKEFEVTGWKLKISEEGTIRTRLSLKETSEAAFDWNAEEAIFASNNTNLPDFRATAAVSMGVVVVQLTRDPSGAELPVLISTWSVTDAQLAADYLFQWRENTLDYEANGGFVELASPTAREQLIYDAYLSILNRVPDQDGFDFYVSGAQSSATIDEVRSELASSTEGQNPGQFRSMVTRATQAELRALEFGKRYDLRVSSRNHLGITSSASATTHLVELDTTPPPVPTASDRQDTLFGKQPTIRWTNPITYGSGAPVYDLRDTEIWRGSSTPLTLDAEGDPTNADLVGRSRTEEYIDTTTEWDTAYYYFLRARDYAGNLSAFDSGRRIATGAAPENRAPNGDFGAGTAAGWNLYDDLDEVSNPLKVSHVRQDPASDFAPERNCPYPGMIKVEMGSPGDTNAEYEVNSTDTANTDFDLRDYEHVLFEVDSKMPILSGEDVTASFSMAELGGAVENGWTDNGDFPPMVRVYFYDQDEVRITAGRTFEDDYALVIGPSAAGGDTWQRFSAVFTPPAGAHFCSFEVVGLGTAGGTTVGFGVSYFSGFDIRTAAGTQSISRDAMRRVAFVQGTDLVPSADDTTEVILTATIILPDLPANADQGEDVEIKVTAGGFAKTSGGVNIQFFLRLDGVNGNGIDFTSQTGLSLSGRYVVPAGDSYTIDLTMKTGDVTVSELDNAFLDVEARLR